MKRITAVVIFLMLTSCTGRIRRTYYMDDFKPGDSIVVGAQDGTDREVVITIER